MTSVLPFPLSHPVSNLLVKPVDCTSSVPWLRASALCRGQMALLSHMDTCHAPLCWPHRSLFLHQILPRYPGPSYGLGYNPKLLAYQARLLRSGPIFPLILTDLPLVLKPSLAFLLIGNSPPHFPVSSLLAPHASAQTSLPQGIRPAHHVASSTLSRVVPLLSRHTLHLPSTNSCHIFVTNLLVNISRNFLLELLTQEIVLCTTGDK